MSAAKKPFWMPAAAIAACACFSTVAFGQQRPDAGSILEQQQQRDRLPQAPSTAPVLPQTTPSKPAMPASSTIRVTVKEFRLSGNTVFSAAELAAVLQGFIGKTLGFDELNDAAGRIRLKQSFAQAVLNAHLKPGEPVTEAALERALLLRDLPGVDVSSALGASKTQVGAALAGA